MEGSKIVMVICLNSFDKSSKLKTVNKNQPQGLVRHEKNENSTRGVGGAYNTTVIPPDGNGVKSGMTARRATN